MLIDIDALSVHQIKACTKDSALLSPKHVPIRQILIGHALC